MPKDQQLTAYEEFLTGLEEEGIPDALYPIYEAVQSLNEAFSPLHKRDKYGRIPLLKEETRENLMRLHEAMGAKAEKLLSDPTVGEQEKDLVKKLAALAASNYRHLRNYDPKEPRTLPELLEDARTLTIDLRGASLNDPVGSAQNERQPLTFLDDQGREVTGLFTPKKIAGQWEAIDRRLKKYAESKKAPKAAREYFQKLMSDLDTPKGAKVLGLPEDADRSAKLAELYTMVLAKQKDDFAKGVCELISALYSTKEKPLTPQQVRNEMQEKWAITVAAVVETQGTAILNNNMIAKIHDGARMDNRNAAMSAVAELLNVPNLIAKSAPMKIINRDGKVVEGTFMLEAEGVDVGNMTLDDSLYNKNSLQNLDGRAMKSIADLQVLDYICGNTDRHSGNVTYQFDKRTGKLIGVQGFDNDTAFGVLDPKDGDFIAHLTLPENMLAVSDSMYQRLCQITPEVLKFSLRGFGLTEAELDAAVKRMEHLKEAIQAGKEFYADREKAQAEALEKAAKSKTWVDPNTIDNRMVVGKNLRVLKDEEWRNLSWKELSRDYSFERWSGGELKKDTFAGNFFTRAYAQVASIPRVFQKQKYEYQSLRSEEAIGTGNRALNKTLDRELNKAEQMELLLQNRTKRYHSSGNYKKMQTAAKNYRVFLEGLRTRITNARENMELLDAVKIEKDNESELFLPMQAVITVDDLNEMQRLSREIRDAAQTYLIGKGILPKQEGQQAKNTVDDYEPYTRDRIAAAETLMNIGNQGSRIREAEIETAVRNQHRAQEEINRRFGNILEKEHYEPPVRPKPEAENLSL